ncbi:hypothetical protein [Collimonas fungivorans]|uniref:hypothetical protein n=1 Tax=Collimonas fungivorans TaxID=158899 RepID=UPI0007785505|nr:hypothetical protein [Collimonas fungivorans]
MFDGIKAEHSQVMGLTDGMFDFPDTEGFQRPQDLDVFLASAFVHACFEQASQSLEVRFDITAAMVGIAHWLAEKIDVDPIDGTFD